MRRNLLLLFLSLLTVCSASATTYDFGVENDEGVTLYYIVNKDGESVTVTHGDGHYLESVKIPSEVTYNDKTYTVTTIGYRAFQLCPITSIEIPSSVTRIDTEAFRWCNKLVAIDIPDSVEEFGEAVFQGSQILEEIRCRYSSPDMRCLIIDGVLNSFAPGSITTYTVPSTVNEIGRSAFYQMEYLTEVKFPATVTKICAEAFSWGSGMKTLTIPVSVKEIGSFAFTCENLKTLTIESNNPNFPTLGEEVFKHLDKAECTLYVPKGCYSKFHEADEWKGFGAIQDLDFDFCALNEDLIPIYYQATEPAGTASVLHIGTDAGTLTGKVTIPATVRDQEGNSYTVTGIADQAFSGCTDLAEVIIPEAVTSIGAGAFSGCSSMTWVHILGPIAQIGEKAFENCTSLANFEVNNPDPSSITLGDGVFAGCNLTKATLWVPKGSVTSYNNAPQWKDFFMTSITDFDFKAANVNDVDIYYIFNPAEDGGDPTTVTVTYGYWEAGSYTGEVVIPGEVAYEGKSYTVTGISHAFYCCPGLTAVTIPDTVTSIEEIALSECADLKSLTVINTDPASLRVDDDVFEDTPIGNVTLYVPEGSKAKYEALDPWRQFGDIVEIHVAGIGSVASDPARVTDPCYYDLMGRQVKNPARGIYIHQGRKIIIK